MWVLFAILSAVFAGVTAILSKCGVKNTDSDVATAIRTSVVLVLAWIVACVTGEIAGIKEISAKSFVFLMISGVATGASWICYFKALSLGEVSRVAAVDKSSVVLSVLFALALFPAERAKWGVKLLCLAAIAAGTYLMTGFKREKRAELAKQSETQPDGAQNASDAQSVQDTENAQGVKKQRAAWLIFALLSAVFAAATSVLAKIGIEGVSSNLATAIRTCAVLVMAWLIVFCRGKAKEVKRLPKKDFLFLVLLGVATAASWLCYYYAIAKGQVSVVAPIDKLSILVTVGFSYLALGERLSKKQRIGLLLLTAGTLCMAIFAK